MKNSAIFYEGPSVLDPDVHVCGIVSGLKRGSNNPKTGDMLQTWILRADMHPNAAHHAGDNKAACGDCPFSGGACYVQWGFAPTALWRAARDGRLPRLDDFMLPEKPVRFGAAGDPVAIPYPAWLPLMTVAERNGYTGYTHQWHTLPSKSVWSQWLMASTENIVTTAQARHHGWRTFRVKHESDPLDSAEIYCPSERVSCADCGLCRGNGKGYGFTAKHIAINVHGASASKF